MNGGEGDLLWFSLCTKPRYEKTAATLLRYQDYDCYYPVHMVRRRWSDRIKELEKPLFPGYIFCRLDPAKRLPVLKTAGVGYIIGVGGKPTPVDESEISALKTLEQSGLTYSPSPFLKVGQQVKVKSGPLRGVEGMLVKIRNQSRLVLSVTLLQRSVATEIDAADVVAA